MVDDAFEEPGPHVFHEVLVGDPLELDDRDSRDVTEADGDQPAVIEPAETMLQPVVQAPAGRTSGGSSRGDRGCGRRETSSSAPAACRRRRRTRRRAGARMRARSGTAHGSPSGPALTIRPTCVGQLACQVRLGGLGDHPDDRLGVAGADVHPAIVPVEPQSVAAVGPGVGARGRDPVPECGDRAGGIA